MQTEVGRGVHQKCFLWRPSCACLHVNKWVMRHTSISPTTATSLVSTLMLLFECLHLLLLLVASVNGFSNRATNRTPYIFTSMVVT